MLPELTSPEVTWVTWPKVTSVTWPEVTSCPRAFLYYSICTQFPLTRKIEDTKGIIRSRSRHFSVTSLPVAHLSQIIMGYRSSKQSSNDQTPNMPPPTPPPPPPPPPPMPPSLPPPQYSKSNDEENYYILKTNNPFFLGTSIL